ncbi:unnamed protein product, partial [Prorocentrum cordatum]
GTGLFSLPREHGSSAQGGHFLAHRGRAACLLREWERRAEGAGAGAGTFHNDFVVMDRPRAVADRTAKKPRVP